MERNFFPLRYRRIIWQPIFDLWSVGQLLRHTTRFIASSRWIEIKVIWRSKTSHVVIRWRWSTRLHHQILQLSCPGHKQLHHHGASHVGRWNKALPRQTPQSKAATFQKRATYSARSLPLDRTKCKNWIG